MEKVAKYSVNRDQSARTAADSEGTRSLLNIYTVFAKAPILSWPRSFVSISSALLLGGLSAVYLFSTRATCSAHLTINWRH